MMPTFAASVPVWMRQVVTLPGPCSGAKGSALCDGVTLGRQIYGEREGTQFAAFAYLWRRFGPPWWGSDDHKELVQYVLGTPHAEVFLTLGLSASPLPYAIGYLVTRNLEEQFGALRRAWDAQFDAWWIETKATESERRLLEASRASGETPPFPPAITAIADKFWQDRLHPAVVAEAKALLGPIPNHFAQEGKVVVEGALTTAMAELLRPVFIRDVAINILGRVSDTHLDEREAAAPSPYAGHGMQQWAMAAMLAKNTRSTEGATA